MTFPIQISIVVEAVLPFALRVITRLEATVVGMTMLRKNAEGSVATSGSVQQGTALTCHEHHPRQSVRTEGCIPACLDDVNYGIDDGRKEEEGKYLGEKVEVEVTSLDI